MLTLKFLTSVFMFLVLNLEIRLKLWNNSNNKRKACCCFKKGTNKIAQKVKVLLVKPTGPSYQHDGRGNQLPQIVL